VGRSSWAEHTARNDFKATLISLRFIHAFATPDLSSRRRFCFVRDPVLLLNRPEVILISRIGFVAWYPAIGLVIALLLGVSPWYALLVCLADALRESYLRPAGHVLQQQRGSVGSAFCYGAAAYVLRNPSASIWGCVTAGMWSGTSLSVRSRW